MRLGFASPPKVATDSNSTGGQAYANIGRRSVEAARQATNRPESGRGAGMPGLCGRAAGIRSRELSALLAHIGQVSWRLGAQHHFHRTSARINQAVIDQLPEHGRLERRWRSPALFASVAHLLTAVCATMALRDRHGRLRENFALISVKSSGVVFADSA
jgi:hypothetical protein